VALAHFKTYESLDPDNTEGPVKHQVVRTISLSSSLQITHHPTCPPWNRRTGACAALNQKAVEDAEDEG
jgi:hypothetical protein